MNQIKLSHEENITSGLNGLKKERDFYRDRTQTLQARLDLLIAWYESNPQISDTWIDQCIQDWKNNQVHNIQESLLSTDYIVEGIEKRNIKTNIPDKKQAPSPPAPKPSETKIIYVVTAHNTYQGNQHSYVVGVYEDWEDAKKAANIEEMSRGGKYECRFNEYKLNELP